VKHYAAHIVDGTVTHVIVGDPAWAADRLGGTWVASESKVGIGWTYDDGTFAPPVPDPDGEGLPEWSPTAGNI
jgi:hypothetical protein